MTVRLTFTAAARLAEAYFGISLPTTPDELKGAFRKATKLLRGDVGGDDKKFIEMK